MGLRRRCLWGTSARRASSRRLWKPLVVVAMDRAISPWETLRFALPQWSWNVWPMNENEPILLCGSPWQLAWKWHTDRLSLQALEPPSATRHTKASLMWESQKELTSAPLFKLSILSKTAIARPWPAWGDIDDSKSASPYIVMLSTTSPSPTITVLSSKLLASDARGLVSNLMLLLPLIPTTLPVLKQPAYPIQRISQLAVEKYMLSFASLCDIRPTRMTELQRVSWHSHSLGVTISFLRQQFLATQFSHLFNFPYQFIFTLRCCPWFISSHGVESAHWRRPKA